MGAAQVPEVSSKCWGISEEGERPGVKGPSHRVLCLAGGRGAKTECLFLKDPRARGRTSPSPPAAARPLGNRLLCLASEQFSAPVTQTTLSPGKGPFQVATSDAQGPAALPPCLCTPPGDPTPATGHVPSAAVSTLNI